MKILAIALFSTAALSLQAQYKAPSQYFRKDFPAPKPGAPQQQQPAATPKPPAQATQPRFKDLTTNSLFHFLSDTNRAYPWVKISATVATNVKTGVRQTLSPELPVRR